MRDSRSGQRLRAVGHAVSQQGGQLCLGDTFIGRDLDAVEVAGLTEQAPGVIEDAVERSPRGVSCCW